MTLFTSGTKAYRKYVRRSKYGFPYIKCTTIEEVIERGKSLLDDNILGGWWVLNSLSTPAEVIEYVYDHCNKSPMQNRTKDLNETSYDNYFSHPNTPPYILEKLWEKYKKIPQTDEPFRKALLRKDFPVSVLKSFMSSNCYIGVEVEGLIMGNKRLTIKERLNYYYNFETIRNTSKVSKISKLRRMVERQDVPASILRTLWNEWKSINGKLFFDIIQFQKNIPSDVFVEAHKRKVNLVCCYHHPNFSSELLLDVLKNSKPLNFDDYNGGIFVIRDRKNLSPTHMAIIMNQQRGHYSLSALRSFVDRQDKFQDVPAYILSVAQTYLTSEDQSY